MGKTLRPRFNDRARSRHALSNKTDPQQITVNTVDESNQQQPTGVDDPLLLQPGMSRTKRKRLEKYIEKRLKKEKRVELISQLAQSNFNSDLLATSKHLGKGKETTRERLRRALKEERAGFVDVDENGPSELFRERDATAYDDIAYDATASDLMTSEDGGDKLSIGQAGGTNVNYYAPPSLPPSVTTDAPLTIKISKIAAANPNRDNNEKEDDDDDTRLKQQYADNPNYQHKPGTPLYIPVRRTEATQQARLQLPILSEEQRIMELIAQNDVVVLCGETGSGKTTQLPQFLYEAGYGSPDSALHSGMIGVTEPRRMAAISMAKRVGYEMGLTGKTVSYQVRYDGTAGDETVIKFMTDGVLLKEISADFLLTNYSCLIIDEAHERSLNTDILIGLLSRIVVLRGRLSRGEISEDQLPAKMRSNAAGTAASTKPLKLVIMSATLQVGDFTANKRLFPQGTPPVFRIDSRQYPVTVHFNRRTADDYVDAAFRKVSKIHTQLPSGGILIFLPGRNEIMALVRRLKSAFPSSSASASASVSGNSGNLLYKQPISSYKSDGKEYAGLGEDEDYVDDDFMEDDGNLLINDRMATLKNDDFDETQDFSEEEEVEVEIEKTADSTAPNAKDPSVNSRLHVLPLYSLMSTADQMRVFNEPPAGTRLCVVATNIAETSLTIPGIKYVVDSGRAKERHYNIATSVSTFAVDFASKAAANQRAGRAGRTSAGHCYRLYSSAAFGNTFADHSRPEIQRMPLDGVLLHMKSIGIDSVVNFPFPTAPEREQLLAAERLLCQLKALDGRTKRITADGRLMAQFPLAPRFARMILTAAGLEGESGGDWGLLDYTIAMVAAISASSDPFMPRGNEDDGNGNARAMKQFSRGLESDSLVLLRIIGAYEYAADKQQFCSTFNIREKAMRESQQLRSQLCRISQKLFPGFTASMKMKPLDAKDVKRLHEILLCGYIDQIAMRCDDPNIYNNINTTTTGNISKVKFYLPLTACTFRESILNHPIFIHPESCLSRSSGRRDFPKFIVYGQLLMQSTADRTRSTNDGRTAKIHMRNLTAINESEQSIIARIGSHLCRWGKPMDHPPPFYCPQRHRVLCYAQPTFGDRQVDLPPVPVEYATLDSVNNSCGFSYASDCARHLAKAIVDGHVFPQMNQFAQFIRQSSSVLINPKLPVVHSKLMNLVVPLSQRKLCDREGLLAALREQPRFLLPGIMEWYHSECHTNLQTTWLSLSTM